MGSSGESAPQRGRRSRVPRLVAGGVTVALVATTGVWFLDRQRAEAHLATLEDAGLLSVVDPDLAPFEASTVEPLPDGRGIVVGYSQDGEQVPGVQLVQVKAGSDPDLCAVLLDAQPDLAGAECAADGRQLSAATPGSEPTVLVEGVLRADTLAVVRSRPADLESVRSRILLDNAPLMSVQELHERVG